MWASIDASRCIGTHHLLSGSFRPPVTRHTWPATPITSHAVTRGMYRYRYQYRDTDMNTYTDTKTSHRTGHQGVHPTGVGRPAGAVQLHQAAEHVVRMEKPHSLQPSPPTCSPSGPWTCGTVMKHHRWARKGDATPWGCILQTPQQPPGRGGRQGILALSNQHHQATGSCHTPDHIKSRQTASTGGA